MAKEKKTPKYQVHSDSFIANLFHNQNHCTKIDETIASGQVVELLDLKNTRLMIFK